MSRIKDLGIFFLCMVRIRIKPPQKECGEPKKVLIIQRAKLGDMVCTTPMFRAVKQKYPNARLYVIGDAINKQLLSGSPHVDEYIVFNNDFFGIARKIRRSKVDFACTTVPDFTSLAALVLGGVTCIAAPVAVNGKSIQTRMHLMLAKRVIQKTHRMGHYAAREYLKLLEPIGIFSEDTAKELSFTEEAEKRVRSLFKESDLSLDKDFIVGMTPSAGNKIKEWPAENFAGLADYIYKKYKIKIVLLGGPNDAKEVDAMKAALDPNTRVVDLAGKLSIDELKACVARLNLFISVDTGPIYIAEAFDVPTIDITGPIDEREQPPIGKYHVVVTPPEREKPELFVMNAREYNYAEARRQAESITVGAVTQAFERLYEIINSEHLNK